MKLLLTIFTAALVLTIFAAQADAAQCTYLLKNQRGTVLETLTGNGYDQFDACQMASRRCSRALLNGGYQGRYLHCEKQTLVVRTCFANMINRRGNVIQTFNARAQGQQGRRVYQRACQRALTQCNNARYNQGRRHAACVVNSRTSRPPHRRPRTRPLPPHRRPRTRPIPPRRGPGRPVPPHRRPGRPAPRHP